MSGSPFCVEIDCFHRDQKMTEKELQKLFGLVGEEKGIVLRPINTSMGFSVGFAVGHVTPAPELRGALAGYEGRVVFREDQLPEGYTFSDLAPYAKDSRVRTLWPLGQR